MLFDFMTLYIYLFKKENWCMGYVSLIVIIWHKHIHSIYNNINLLHFIKACCLFSDMFIVFFNLSLLKH